MLKITENNSGVYLLELFTPDSFFIGIKKFRNIKFPSGYYYYAGSAQKNLNHRLARHIKKRKTIHWHIDHITSKNHFRFKSIFIIASVKKEVECKIVENLLSVAKIKIIAEGFGNSDCNSCRTHLLHSKKKIDHNHLLSLYHSIVRFIPSSKDKVCL